MKSYHQYTPHDSFDWDEVSAPLLIDTEVDGKLTKTFVATIARRSAAWSRCITIDMDGGAADAASRSEARPNVSPAAHKGTVKARLMACRIIELFLWS
jgi:glucose dehydrogenase